MSTTEQINFTNARVYFMDDTPTTPLFYRLLLRQGAVSYGPVNFPLLNEMLKTESDGQSTGLFPGGRIYPQISLEGMKDTFSDSSNGRVEDFLASRAPYASRIDPDLNSPYAHAHLRIDFDRPVAGDVQSICFERCAFSMNGNLGDKNNLIEQFTAEQLGGRIWKNGVLEHWEAGTNTGLSAPDWVTYAFP